MSSVMQFSLANVTESSLRMYYLFLKSYIIYKMTRSGKQLIATFDLLHLKALLPRISVSMNMHVLVVFIYLLWCTFTILR